MTASSLTVLQKYQFCDTVGLPADNGGCHDYTSPLFAKGAGEPPINLQLVGAKYVILIHHLHCKNGNRFIMPLFPHIIYHNIQGRPKETAHYTLVHIFAKY